LAHSSRRGKRGGINITATDRLRNVERNPEEEDGIFSPDNKWLIITKNE
jgi:hypothetical protein